MHIGMTEAMVKIGDEIWTVPVHYNFLVAINVNTGVTRYICQMTEQKDERLYAEIVNYNNKKLFFLPMSADSMAVYDLSTGSIEYISVEVPTENVGKTHYKEKYKFARCRFFGGDMYLFPCTFPAIIKINPESYEINYFSDWVYSIEEIIDIPDEVYFRDCFVKEETVYMASCCSNAVLEFDVKTKKSYLHVVGDKSFSTITFVNDWFYLTSKQGNELIRIRSLDSERYEVISKDDRYPAIATLVLNNKICVISSNLKETYCLTPEEYLLNCDFDDDVTHGVLAAADGVWYVGENHPLLRHYGGNQGDEEQVVKLTLDDEIIRHVFKKKGINGVYNEGVISLKDYFFLVNSY